MIPEDSSSDASVGQCTDLNDCTQSRPDNCGTSEAGTLRVLDACMNRAREGIRVLEDYARFILNDGLLVRNLKDLRHRLGAAERDISTLRSKQANGEPMLVQRDVEGDVGTEITGTQEQVRDQIPDIVHANVRRVQEALRSLEEFGKLIDKSFAAEMKQLRYQTYTFHQQMLMALETNRSVMVYRRHRLQAAQVCVLITESGCRGSWKRVVESCLEGGADMIQLREKQLEDRTLLTRATWLAEACHSADALCLINDRPDIADLSGADGAHLGQDDCQVGDARRLLGPDSIIGLSTHSVQQMSCSDAQAADYLGVGPVFSSVTKQFQGLAGLGLLREMSELAKPWFAIGGINPENITQTVDAGAQRIAVSAAAIAADRPGQVIQMLREQLPVR